MTASQFRVSLISTELAYIVFAVSSFCSTIVNAKAFGKLKVFFIYKHHALKPDTHSNKKLRN